jgi:hypothetical protein
MSTQAEPVVNADLFERINQIEVNAEEQIRTKNAQIARLTAEKNELQGILSSTQAALKNAEESARNAMASFSKKAQNVHDALEKYKSAIVAETTLQTNRKVYEMQANVWKRHEDVFKSNEGTMADVLSKVNAAQESAKVLEKESTESIESIFPKPSFIKRADALRAGWDSDGSPQDE